MQHAITSGQQAGMRWPCCPLRAATTTHPRRSAPKLVPAALSNDQTPAASSSVAEVVASPLTCATAISGFALIASFIPVLSSVEGSPQAQPDLTQLAGAAQAASLPDAAASSVSTTAAAASASDQAVVTLSNPILQLDETVHQYVATHTSAAFRHMADVWISDAFITAGVCGWAACTAACLIKAPRQSAPTLGASWACYFLTCGAVGHGDPLLVDTLKQSFARIRPSELHHTFSFPSGHTSAAVFTVGALLTVLLPLTLQLWSAQAAQPVIHSSSISTSTSTSSSQAAASVVTADASILAVWSAAWGATALGRILSESHWLSDTVAGGLLAVGSVSALAWCTRLLTANIGGGSGSAVAVSTLREGESEC